MILYGNCYYPGEKWERCDSNSIEIGKLDSIDRKIRRDIKRINSFLVLKDGYILFEKYYNGCGEDTHNVLMSVTKSVISCLVGIMCGEYGYELLEMSVSEFFPQAGNFNPMLNHMTLKSLLAMNSGMMHLPGRNGSEPLAVRMQASQNWLDFIMGLPFDVSKSGRFTYNSINSHLISCIITKVTGTNACEYAKMNLPFISGSFESKKTAESMKFVMGDKTAGWHQDTQGNSTGGWGLTLTAREMAKFGLLYLRKGIWNGKVVLDGEYVHMSTHRYDESVNYGLHWWVDEVNGKATFSAKGWGGQMICCVPGENIVIVAASGTDSNFNTATDPSELVAAYLAD